MKKNTIRILSSIIIFAGILFSLIIPSQVVGAIPMPTPPSPPIYLPFLQIWERDIIFVCWYKAPINSPILEGSVEIQFPTGYFQKYSLHWVGWGGENQKVGCWQSNNWLSGPTGYYIMTEGKIGITLISNLPKEAFFY